MQHVEQRLRQVQEHQAHYRAQREAERVALAAERQARRSVRRQVGESLVRLGHRVAGENIGSPALTG